MHYEHYFLERDQLELQVYRDLLKVVKEKLDSAVLDNLPYLSFVMLKPDSYLRGLMPKVIELLKAHQIYPVQASLVGLSQELIDSLYMFVKQKYADTWWVMEKTYTLAPVLPLVLVGNPGEFEHLSERIRALIGPTTPLAGDPEQIRYQLKATHRVFNIIHGTDDPGSAMREALIFFSYQQIEDSLRQAAELRLGNISAVERRSSSLLDLRTLVPDTVLDLRFSRVKVDAKSKAFGDVYNIVTKHSIKDGDKLCGRMHVLLDQEYDTIERELPLLEERAELSIPLHQQHSLMAILQDRMKERLVRVARNKQAEEDTARIDEMNDLEKGLFLAHFILTLTDDVRFKSSDFDRLISGLVSYGVLLDKYEEVVLHTGWAVAPQELVDLHTEAAIPSSPGRAKLPPSASEWWHPVATAIVIREDAVLLIPHDQPPIVGWWCPPGGHLTGGELPHEAVIREVEEECGLQVEIVEPFVMQEYRDEIVKRVPMPTSIQLERIGPDHYHYNLNYVCRVVGGRLTREQGKNNPEWIPFDKLRELTTCPQLPTLVDIVRNWSEVSKASLV